MSNYVIGMTYEDFVEQVYAAILEAEKRNGRIDHVALERRKKIISKSGTPSEIDIYWEYTLAGIKNAVAIECKNFNKNVDIAKVRDFARKISDISGLKGLMVTKKGFSKHAIDEAKADNIDLLVVREHKDADWNGHIKTIHIQYHIGQASRTRNIQPYLDKEWAKEKGFKDREEIQLNIRNDLLIFEDLEGSFRHSLHELESKHFFEDKDSGSHTWEREFKGGWMHIGEESYKLDRIIIDYYNPPVIKQEQIIDFEQYVLAVMEYVSGTDEKYVVLRNGEKKEY